MDFTKMHGLGNDYIFLNCMESTPDNLGELARRLSDRHFGVGETASSASVRPTGRISA